LLLVVAVELPEELVSVNTKVMAVQVVELRGFQVHVVQMIADIVLLDQAELRMRAVLANQQQLEQVLELVQPLQHLRVTVSKAAAAAAAGMAVVLEVTPVAVVAVVQAT
jgi:hypothetical protein